MANLIIETKKKIQDLFVYIVSCGKSSKEPSRNDQGPSRDAPLGDEYLGQKVYIPEETQDAGVPPPRNNAQGQLPHLIVLQPGKNTQNQGHQPTINIPPVQENIEQQDQGHIVVVPPVQENIEQQKQDQKQENDDDIEPLPEGFVPEERANFSRPPGKRSAPIPKTG